MRWAGHEARMGEMRNEYKTLLKTAKRRDHTKYLGVGGRILLKQIIMKSGFGLRIWFF
jgi:hypothetical protein